MKLISKILAGGMMMTLLLVPAGIAVASPTYFSNTHLPAECNGNPNTSTFCQTCDQLHLVDDKACTRQDSLLGDVLTTIIRVASLVLGAVAVVAIIIGGGMYVFSSGEAANIKRAKDIILYALIGLIVAIFAQAIVVFVLGRIA